MIQIFVQVATTTLSFFAFLLFGAKTTALGLLTIINCIRSPVETVSKYF